MVYMGYTTLWNVNKQFQALTTLVPEPSSACVNLQRQEWTEVPRLFAGFFLQKHVLFGKSFVEHLS